LTTVENLQKFALVVGCPVPVYADAADIPAGVSNFEQAAAG